MVLSLVKRAFGTANDRYLKKLHRDVEAINALEPGMEELDDAALRARTDAFRTRLAAGEKVDDLLVEAFATVREAAKRTLGQRHFDVQLLGAMILNKGMISEMKTGEGKTLVATLAVYLNALEGKGVHVVTVNDYLAQRDSGWMGQVYNFLGLTTGCITNSMSDEERRAAYAADVTYGTNNEFGFDYLRDNMKFHLEEMVQREFNYAIVDEVDSILIDEARTPLIISGQVEDSTAAYAEADKIIPMLIDEDYEIDEKARAATLTDQGVEHTEALLAEAGLLEGGASLYDITSVTILHHINQALRAHKLFQRDKDYIAHEGRIVIIDEFTGRMMEGRRFSDGLHQALEAKEGVEVQNENQTLASITFQNYFRLYPKLAGMTGTAMTESAEFAEIYKLEVVDIPTHRPMVRDDQNDEVYRTLEEKYNAINDLIEEANKRGQPVLVGTVSIEKSEEVSEALKSRKIPHEILNARHHEREAQIIGQAGATGAVTIATNMAGRGTDIQLGGNLDMRLEAELADMEDGPARDEKEASIRAEVEKFHDTVIAAGGLMVIGTERHESRRIDNQLRGRSGRQGDPGTSRFFLSLQDDLMRIFGSERMDGMLTKLGIEEGEAIVHPWINKALEKAQQKVEARNFEIRKQLLQYDDVMNDQRKVIYEQRKDLMRTDDVSDTIKAMRAEALDDVIARTIPEKVFAEQWDTDLLHEEAMRIFGLDIPADEWAAEEGIADEEIHDRLEKMVDERMAAKVANYGEEIMRMAEKNLLLQILDQHWKDHLLRLDHLRQGIGLRAFGQKNPLNEYKREAFDMFQDMLGRLREGVTQLLSHIEIQVNVPDAIPEPRSPQSVEAQHTTVGQFGDATPRADETGAGAASARSQATATIDPEDPSTWGKVPRNAPCPCGTGKKYKHCHGRSA
ncbi:MAG: preprotein translocase subunit SecA [Rhodospirillaceae bacterium]|jgi:preprotein translocase subunit SecA|nr:preprotein translocase subunit SecA [Rhodospirillaceae bacterium]MBT4771293.1 preprotein translocase subunit SecA [Rhodospirillaceae bacterium]MBT5357137.1 preprotein translocase subunit SecA [Rhodospirillaceae bacterium]MBT5769162.1 preprotein translocase subunit SecA [Rhodospirillaceae bacterium]MBT6308759.1 preprotein translocase subunit SecA [Rhodospirillaceae bacterium]